MLEVGNAGPYSITLRGVATSQAELGEDSCLVIVAFLTSVQGYD